MPDKSLPVFQSKLAPFDTGNILPVEINCSGKLDKNSIDITFTATGLLENISFDSPSKHPRRTDNLWQKTCFEVFVKNADSAKYWEYNLSPSLNWAIYGFENYREGKFDELSLPKLPVDTSFQPNLFLLKSDLPLPAPLIGKNLKIGLSVVVQDKNGDIYYYALKHTKVQADFHDAESFTIEIKP